MSSDEKFNCGCIVIMIIAVILVAIFRYYIMTPSGWGF